MNISTQFPGPPGAPIDPQLEQSGPAPAPHSGRPSSQGCIMLDIQGTRLEPDDIRRITHPLVCGIILFTRNYKNREQLTELTSQIRTINPQLIISVDHEGGRVQRFREGFTALPAMRGLGQLWDKNPSLAAKTATAIAYILAAELRACHIDLSFTPVLDLDYGVSEVIGNRAFHRDAAVVSMLAQHFCHGLLLAGMANCGKHFPGHGKVAADSHTEIPVDERTLNELREDMRPYQNLGIALKAVMPAHVIYPHVDARPAGFSHIWLQKILREELQFTGVICSDDLSMQGAYAISQNVVERAQAALQSGCDIALICNQPEQADQLLNHLEHTPSPESLQRIASLSTFHTQENAHSWLALQSQPHYLAAQALLQENFPKSN